MNSQALTFFLAVAILIVVWITAFAAKRRGSPFLEAEGGAVERWSMGQLLLASFLTLFAELAFIRWIAVEVRVFAYFKNLALLLCFVGFGLGCALAAQRARWKSALLAFLGLLLIVRMPWRGAELLEGLSESLGGAGDIAIWATGNNSNWLQYGMAVLVAGALFLLIVSVFVPLGQTVSRQMDLAPSALRAYSWNLVGSLVGVVAFFAVSLLMLPPAVWLGAVVIGFAFLQTSRRDIVLVASLIVPLVLLLHGEAGPDTTVLWTPYQQVQYTPVHTPDGEVYGGVMRVNHALYQKIVNLSDEFLARHPRVMKELPDENPYNLPFRFALPNPAVMIVGSGTGNDVAAALRHGSSRVDAVEIDPAILGLGKRKHPEHPYDSPRVSIHVDDARAFLKRTKQSYDLILFGLLDSHAQFSDYANMRIDNFVYTAESFREAARHLTPNGVIFVKFQVDHRWMGTRLVEILQQTFGKPPSGVSGGIELQRVGDVLCDFDGEPGGRGSGRRSAAGGVCAQESFCAADGTGSGYHRRLALSLSGREVDSADLLFDWRAGDFDCAWAVCTDWWSSAECAVAVFLQHGCGISFAGDAGDQPAGAVLWNGLAGEWDCDFRVADRVAAGECCWSNAAGKTGRDSGYGRR